MSEAIVFVLANLNEEYHAATPGDHDFKLKWDKVKTKLAEIPIMLK